jgi:hypothetical protein
MAVSFLYFFTIMVIFHTTKVSQHGLNREQLNRKRGLTR